MILSSIFSPIFLLMHQCGRRDWPTSPRRCSQSARAHSRPPARADRSIPVATMSAVDTNTMPSSVSVGTAGAVGSASVSGAASAASESPSSAVAAAASSSSSLDLPAHNSTYKRKEYWEERFSKEEKYEWLSGE